MIAERSVTDFISRHRLPASFERLIDEHYNVLASWLLQRRSLDRPLFLGINGAQGTGKTTLAEYLKLVLEEDEGWRVAAFSIDDFYLTRAARKKLGETVHPLLATRGVPGTHDLPLLLDCIDQLKSLGADESLRVPQFDKARDDRADIGTWPIVTGPIDLMILEGWCVGSIAQDSKTLSKPVNDLERDLDPEGIWRRYVNAQLGEGYARIFAELDYLFFLQAPNFEAIHRWRREQEEKLAATSPKGSLGIMNDVQIASFLQHFERLTRANLVTLSKTADIVLELDENHGCKRRTCTAPK